MSTSNKKLIILTGKSASGKDATAKKLISDYGYSNIVSMTTRPMREGEIDGVEYYFISDREFDMLIKYNRFIEYRTYHTLLKNISNTWRYGTLKQKLLDDKKYVMVLDLKGAKAVLDYYGSDLAEVIYIDSDAETRTSRASLRGGFDETEWNRRLIADEKDFTNEKRYGIITKEVKNNDKTLDELIREVLL